MKRVYRWILAVAGLGILAWIGFVAFLMLKPVWEDHAHRAPFESAGWLARSLDEDEMWPTRLRMVDSLMGGKVLYGLSREEVEGFLGPPDAVPEGRLVYLLGPQRGLMRIDSEILVIHLDASGKVAGYETAAD